MTSAFDDHSAYTRFATDVIYKKRYIRSVSTERFLRSVRKTIPSRTSNYSKAKSFWRAQAGSTLEHDNELGGEVRAPFKPERMMPLPDRALEGRANPKGKPVLYLCSNKEAAMSEVRPWLETFISVGKFTTTKELKLVNCTKHASEDMHFSLFDDPPKSDWDEIVWSEIDKAFTTPVTRSDDSADYVPTQILAELFREEGYDGILYRSAFGERSVNLALFDLDSARLGDRELHQVSSAKFNFRERGRRYKGA